jgi:hypothetical protein
MYWLVMGIFLVFVRLNDAVPHYVKGVRLTLGLHPNSRIRDNISDRFKLDTHHIYSFDLLKETRLC